MSGNTFGKLLTLTTAGESHGFGYLGIIDGCPPHLPLCVADLQKELDRRRPGRSRHVTQRQESDRVTITAGVFEGQTTGTPIGLLIHNEDQRPRDYTGIKDVLRPGHADYTYHKKYGIRDYRGGGRASARETCMRVAAGAVAKHYLHKVCGITIHGYLSQIGMLRLDCVSLASVDDNPFFCPDPERVSELSDFMSALRKSGDSIGARVDVVAKGMPDGLGEPVFDGLDADIAKAMMSINAVKGVEIGDGFGVVEQRGTVHRDEYDAGGFLSNHAGGTLGGISSGQNLRVGIALKPTSSLHLPARGADTSGQVVEVRTKGRHDPCVGLRATPIAEAMLALVLMDHVLRARALGCIEV